MKIRLNISIKMSGQAEPYEEYESVDLTEDELSSEENFADESNPVNFVDGSAAFATPPLPPLTPIRNIVCPQYPMEAVGHKNSPNILKKHETKFSQPTTSQRKVEIGKSFQNKPSVSTLVNTQDILKLSTSTTMESACIAPNSGKVGSILPKPQIVHVKHISNESQNQTIYSQKQPGKVVIIKKNNKFYKIVIPHNVMPNINQSTGPVLINIPEVGPLVISNDPRVTKPNSTPINQPFSLNLDDTHQTRPKIPIPLVKEPKKIPEVSAKEAALSNKKFCWTYCKRRKRDLEGFTFNDRLGFNQSECKKATKCSRTLDSIISKKRTQLINQMYKYNKFKDSVIKNNEVKLIKINAIVGETSKQKRIITSKFEPDKNISPPPNKYSKKRNKTASESKSYDLQNIRFSANEMEQDTDYGGDLLLTKKVVILNDRDKEIVVKKRRPQVRKKLKSRTRKSNKIKIKKIWAKKFAQHKKTVTHNNSFILKPCYVHMVREEHVEEAYRKFCKGMSFSSKQKTGINSNSKAKVGPREKPNINTFAPEIVDLQNRKGTTFVDNIREMFNAKIIKSKDQFKEELNYLKPILIVNERNIGIINYSSQFAKSNIIYIVKENKYFPTSVLRNEDFISAFELGYLKLVDAQLFCKYIMGSEGFNIHEKNEYVSEHNYCISKNKYV